MQNGIEIYTDGSSRGNPGPGGWGAIIMDHAKDSVKEIGGSVKKTTNNQMELQAVIEALSHVPENIFVKIHSDSSYVINGITIWIFAWIKRDWKKLTGLPVENKELWQMLYEETYQKKRKVSFVKVAGHSGIPLNERVDEICTLCADGEEIKLYNGSLSDYKFAHMKKIPGSKKKSSKKKAGTPYSYVSMVNKVAYSDKDWESCEKRVKGQSDAKYKKVFSKEEEESTIQTWTLQSLI